MGNEFGIREIELEGFNRVSKGKVRELFEWGKDRLLIVATDRLSAFDVVFNEPIPLKGIVLTQLSAFWFEKTRAIVPNHLLTAGWKDMPAAVKQHPVLKGRTMLVKKTEPVRVECVARGWLEGSAWKDYQRTGEVCGIKLPPGLAHRERLPEAIFTPATKAEEGHDINLAFAQVENEVGKEVAGWLRERSIELYVFAQAYLEERGIILADTKFEFGWHEGGQLILIDECFTPDSSRFWIKERLEQGEAISLDKQFVRDYLEGTSWNKQPPPPSLPPEVIQGTMGRYLESYRLITGQQQLL